MCFGVYVSLKQNKKIFLPHSGQVQFSNSLSEQSLAWPLKQWEIIFQTLVDSCNSKYFIRWCADMNLFKVSSEISMENIDWFTTVETFSGIQADYAKLLFFCHRLSGKTLNGSVSKCILTGIDPIVSFTDIQFMWWMVTMILFSKMVTRIYW